MIEDFNYFGKSFSLNKIERRNTLKSDLNEMVFVLELWELLCKNITVTTVCIFEKNPTYKKYLDNNDFPLLLFGFIRIKVGKTLFCQVAMTSYTKAY